MSMKPWACLATNWDEVKDVIYPVLMQPKLNGIRAKWDGHALTSRQNKVWKPTTLPDIYDKLTDWSTKYPDITLDGELYCHGMPFQNIEARTAINRNTPHRDMGNIDFHAFDIIGPDDTESRQIALSQIYRPWVALIRADNEAQVYTWLNTFIEAGFEGAMLRSLNCPYIPGRTEALIKLKPWKPLTVRIVGFSEGKDKYTGMLGALVVQHGSITFNVSGGLTDDLRGKIYRHQDFWHGREIVIRCRDVYNSGVPVHPQILALSVKL